MTKHAVTGSLVISALIIGTLLQPAPASAQKKSAPSVPSWFVSLPGDGHSYYVKTTASSKDKQLAIDKAAHEARVVLAKLVQSRVDSVRRVLDKAGALSGESGTRFGNATKEIAVELKGSRIKNHREMKKGKTWTVYLVMEYPLGASSESLVHAVGEDPDISATVGPTEAFRALEAEMKSYQAAKKPPPKTRK
jgi:hypothetical protein